MYLNLDKADGLIQGEDMLVIRQGSALNVRFRMDREGNILTMLPVGDGLGSDSLVELLKFNTIRPWSFYHMRQSPGSDASTALYLLNATGSKSLFVGYNNAGTPNITTETYVTATELSRRFSVWGHFKLESDFGYAQLGHGFIQRDNRSGTNPASQITFNRYLNGSGVWQEIDSGLNGWTVQMRSGDFSVWYSPAGNPTQWTNMFQVDSGRKLSRVLQIYAFNLYRGPSSSVSITDNDGLPNINSITVVDDVAIPAASALPRSDYTIKAGITVSTLSGSGHGYVRVVILKNNATWLDSGYQEVFATGKVFISVGTNVSFADDIYDVVLYVKAFKDGTTNMQITARLDSLVVYV
jgi:hypothetical protein